MTERKHGPTQAWIGYLFNIDANELSFAGAGIRGQWSHYNHPKLGKIVVHENRIYSSNRTFSNKGLESEDFNVFVSGFLGERPFPQDKKGKEFYSAGMSAEVKAAA